MILPITSIEQLGSNNRPLYSGDVRGRIVYLLMWDTEISVPACLPYAYTFLEVYRCWSTQGR